MDATKVAIVFFAVAVPVMAMVVWGLLDRWLKYREVKLELQAKLAAEKAAQYAARSSELEQRVRVLEQIVTDSGAQTASQIEALRARPALKSGEKTQ